MYKIYINFLLSLFYIVLIATNLKAQTHSPLNTAIELVKQNYQQWGLTSTDIADLNVNDITFNKKTGITRVYFNQKHAGVKVYQAILNLTINAEGKLIHRGNRFIPNIANKVGTAIPNLNSDQAVFAALSHLEVPFLDYPQYHRQIDARKFFYEKGDFASMDFNAELVYIITNSGNIELSWQMVLDPVVDSDRWDISINAQTGTVSKQDNWTIYCDFGKRTEKHSHNHTCMEGSHNFGNVNQTLELQQKALSLVNEDNAQYNVLVVPTESPAHGDRMLIQNPAHLEASPFGWHDTNGQDGPEYTITRGNNTWAFQDRENAGSSSGDEPDGGEDLIFDFPYDATQNPENYIDYSVTNLFYMCNVMHDYSHFMGMDEQNGAFQDNNYGNSNNGGGDPIFALAQAGALAGDTNNAFYSHANDGSSPNINMFVWNQAGGGAEFLRVDSPSSIQGTYQTGATNNWGHTIDENPITGEVAIVNDLIFDPYDTDACEDIANSDEINGKIALIDRGGCEFGSKALAAQNSGAIGVIICNFEDDIIGMAAGADGGSVSIPVVFIQSTDCATIRQFVDDGLEVSLVAPQTSGPEFLDGDLDNGIIAHEYAHGISIRLTGGPNSACLGNEEGMGEGWSDFLSLVIGAREGDTPEQRRGVGTYVQRQPNDGRGIRRYPYTTDMNINPLTYGDVAGNTETHAVGEVWCAMIWDLYWAFSEEYYWSGDFYDEESGNNRAVRLIYEGMKNQPCSPGFVDGRDAILAADMELYNGENQCLIWETFARRGLGHLADQGSSASAGDQAENFDALPTCVQEVKMTKSVTALVNAGDEITVTIDIINHKPNSITGVTVTDGIPEGTSFVVGSGSIEGTVNGSEVSFDLPDMDFEDELTLTYQLLTDVSMCSESIFYEDVESEDLFTSAIYVDNTFSTSDTDNPWNLTTQNSNSGEQSFRILDIAEESQNALFRFESLTIEGDNPVFRFYHNYDTEAGADAGLFEITTDEDPFSQGAIWTTISNDKIFRGEYPGAVQYNTFVVPNLEAWSGNSGGWIASYIDMSEYSGQDLFFRFKFGTDDNTPGNVWYIDDLELMDMINYVSTAVLTTNEGDSVDNIPDGRGTVIESKIVSATEEVIADILSMEMYPNPVSNVVNLELNATEKVDLVVSILSADGKLKSQLSRTVVGQTALPIDVQNLAAGVYLVRIQAGDDSFTTKFVKQ